jgi:hypothetical protein
MLTIQSDKLVKTLGRIMHKLEDNSNTYFTEIGCEEMG